MPKPERLEPTYALVYAAIIPQLTEIAKEHGYALGVHGSMATDFDLVACPWTAEATDAKTLVAAVCHYLRAIQSGPVTDPNPVLKPHGRTSWTLLFDHTIDMPQGGPYIDLCVMPRAQYFPQN